MNSNNDTARIKPSKKYVVPWQEQDLIALLQRVALGIVQRYSSPALSEKLAEPMIHNKNSHHFRETVTPENSIISPSKTP